MVVSEGAAEGCNSVCILFRFMAMSGGSGRCRSATALPLRPDFQIQTSAFSGFRRLYPQLRTLRMAVPLVRT